MVAVRAGQIVCRRDLDDGTTLSFTLHEAEMATVISDETFRGDAHEFDDESGAPNHPLLGNEVARELVQFFKLLADETRLRILLYLKERGETNVQTLCGLLEQSQPSVSHHLALLRVAGLIEMRREGKHNFYRTMPRKFEQLMTMMFSALPGNSSRIRFEDFVLSYAQANPEADDS